ncbi:MAG: DUF2851 family protein [Prolixibacteraceae bacterium]
MNIPKILPEEFLQFIWENQLFRQRNLVTTTGESLEIIQPGRKNNDSGPDFFNARVKIGKTEWAGNVEVHNKASDWIQHKHHQDKAYENVVLHVVEVYDKTINRQNNEELPAVVISYPEQYKTNYRKLLDAKTWIPCAEYFHKVDPVLLRLGFNRLMIERLEDKTGVIINKLKENNNNWNETFYQVLARAFGFKINALPFELLAKAVPLNVLAKHKNNLFQLEALLFGTSELLNEELLGDDYYLQLREEYSFLYKKYRLNAIEGYLWKFMRLRPVNFPTIRISQFAKLIHNSNGLLSKITETASLEEMRNLFKVEASSYWKNHYRFNKPGKRSKSKELGEDSVNVLLINVVIPFLFVYGDYQNRDYLKNRALEFLEQLPPEKNSIVKKWEQLGADARSAFETQALLQLKNVHCEQKKCLSCQIGNKLVAMESE